jgi:hypothetical protein
VAQKPAKLKVTKAVGAPYKLPSGAVMRKMFETDEGALKNRNLEEIAGLLWHGEDLKDDEFQVRLIRALDQFESPGVIPPETKGLRP